MKTRTRLAALAASAAVLGCSIVGLTAPSAEAYTMTSQKYSSSSACHQAAASPAYNNSFVRVSEGCRSWWLNGAPLYWTFNYSTR